jgi:hypothetical protein
MIVNTKLNALPLTGHLRAAIAASCRSGKPSEFVEQQRFGALDAFKRLINASPVAFWTDGRHFISDLQLSRINVAATGSGTHQICRQLVATSGPSRVDIVPRRKHDHAPHGMGNRRPKLPLFVVQMSLDHGISIEKALPEVHGRPHNV